MCVLALAGGFTDTAAKAQPANSGNVLKNQPAKATLPATPPATSTNANATMNSNSSNANATTKKAPRKY
jgi:hypothetical protein